MKRFILSVFLIVLAAASAFGQETPTRVSSDIKTNTSWSGTVVVEQPVKVVKGAVLAIKPGTAIRFRKGSGLTVEGVMKAAGKKGSLITFTSDEKVPVAGDWTLSIDGAGGGTVLKRCSISYAASVSMAACDTPVQNCDIQNGGQGLVLARKAQPPIEGNTIKSMLQGGINCQMGSAPVISGNILEKCGPYGITSSQDALPTIKGNTISGCESGIALSKPVPPVENNTLRDNKAGIFLSSVGNGLIIRNNRLSGNESGIVCQQFSSPLIEKNDIAGGKEAIVCFRASSPTIKNNNIHKCESGIICVQLCNPHINANNIFENKKAIYLDLSSYALVNGNNIYSNDIELELGNMSSDWERKVNNKPERGGQAQNISMANRGKAVRQQVDDGAQIMGYVDATGNWWGQSVTAEMDGKGPEANIKSFTDYYDVPTRTYEGYSGVYIQDRIKYDGWKKSRIKSAGYQ
jgi:parallel beta-helix repeat protein